MLFQKHFIIVFRNFIFIFYTIEEMNIDPLLHKTYCVVIKSFVTRARLADHADAIKHIVRKSILIPNYRFMHLKILYSTVIIIIFKWISAPSLLATRPWQLGIIWSAFPNAIPLS